ncbi:MAG: sulfatase-like hydrolase/transferase, partial [bacterium]
MRESKAKPWFLYLAFNAPHTPLQSTEALKARLGHIQDTARRDLAALIVGLDDAIGEVIQTLREEKLYDNTFIVFMSDNGGPITVSKCSNGSLRAGKGTVYE